MSLTRAFSVVNCQSALAWCLFRWRSHAATSFSEGLLAGDAAAQALPDQNGEFGFGPVEPASVLGRVMPFEPFDEAAGFGAGKAA